ncbi:RsmB/NOP family class I SAM-dependent RNA methyltransferase [Rhabdochlamydiaceae symbiont of Dictyostelium giganteum]|uniref:RsmB/NOP family class I SAM-dependent RNA methyltransferase n=1 Tax=Rhabdochlamydiaceae symbiont of Dictyostelium giganteum TaxID=3342349 RepID=UPI00384E45A2
MNFRHYHLLTLIQEWGQFSSPLDVLMKKYFRLHKAIGSKDRAWISDTLYHYVRWKNLYDFLKLSPVEELPHHLPQQIPEFIRLACPEKLLELLSKYYPNEAVTQFCQVNQTRAPTTIRVNLLKTSRDELFQKLFSSYGYQMHFTPHSPEGITFSSKVNFAQLLEFQEGLFEVQDEASQMGAKLVKLKMKDKVLDYCAGSGGKSLAFAPLLKQSGQLYLHDIRPHALLEARKRLKRAGIQNAQFNLPQQKKSMDYVVVDAPCSGTGTYRRNPDLKWKFPQIDLPTLIQEQRDIFENALSYLHPEGVIVYMTCSVLPQENVEQVQFFQEKYGLEQVDIFQTFPQDQGMDGFFAASLKKRAPN